MPAITLDASDAADLADLLTGLREQIDIESDQLEPLLDKHGYDPIGLRVDLDRLTALLTRNDDEPAF